MDAQVKGTLFDLLASPAPCLFVNTRISAWLTLVQKGRRLRLGRMEPYARKFTFSISHRKAGGFGTHGRRVILVVCLTWARRAGGPARVRSV